MQCIYSYMKLTVLVRCIAKFYEQKNRKSIYYSKCQFGSVVIALYQYCTWYCDRVSKPKESQIIYALKVHSDISFATEERWQIHHSNAAK